MKSSSGMSTKKAFNFLATKGVFLVIYHNPLGVLTFDPTITTSESTTIVWDTEAGQTVTTGTTHNLSYTPTAGEKACRITVLGGLQLITSIDLSIDSVSNIIGLDQLGDLVSFVLYGAANTYDLPLGLVSAPALTVNPYCHGALSELSPTSADVSITGAYISARTALVTGTVSDLPASVWKLRLNDMDDIIASSISKFVSCRDFKFLELSWKTASVDTVLLSASDAIHADVNHFTYWNPILLDIRGAAVLPYYYLPQRKNESPSGSIGADLVDPLTTPGTGNSNSDWLWDAGAGKHKALSGKAAIYVMVHNTGHTWAVTYTHDTYNLVFEGDSLTAGGYYPTKVDVLLDIANTGHCANVATSGETTANILSQAAAQVDVWYNAAYANNIAIAWIGANDRGSITAQQIYDNIEAWCVGRAAVGFKTIVCTLPYSTGYPSGSVTDTINALLRDDHAFCDALVDLNADASLQDPTDLVHFTDGLHLTQHAQETITAPLVVAAIQTID